jgi:hypothetical protein
MNPQDHNGLPADPPTIEITEEEILADLSWPGPPPGRWPVRPARVGPDTARQEKPPYAGLWQTASTLFPSGSST